MLKWRIISVDGVLVDLNFLETILAEAGIDRELTPDDIVDAKIVDKAPNDLQVVEDEYYFAGLKVGRKYIHVYYRAAHHTDPETGRIHYYYYKVLRR